LTLVDPTYSKILWGYVLGLLHPFNGLYSRYQKGKSSLDLNKARDDGVWDAVASAGPYANNLHLLQTDNYTNTSSLNFLQVGCFTEAQPTVQSTEALGLRNYMYIGKSLRIAFRWEKRVQTVVAGEYFLEKDLLSLS